MRLHTLKVIHADSGHCWISPLPGELVAGDGMEANQKSALILFENGESLGPAHASHDLVRSKGEGAYSHWESSLFFSTSDNSDPRRNGRTYAVVAETSDEARGHHSPKMKGFAVKQPVNYSSIARSESEIVEDARYALTCAKSYVDALGGVRHLQGKEIVEFGPGINFGTALALLCIGAARATVSDRFLVRFDRQYHPRVYGALRPLIVKEYSNASLAAIDTCLEAGTHESVLETIECSIEDFSAEMSDRFDITLSNAVLEHLFDPKRAAESMFRISKRDSVGLHQVDFRDHRSFDRPLEYLLDDEFTFARTFAECHGECGNRVRPTQLTQMFRAAGFSGIELIENMWADDGYLSSFIVRLQGALASPYSQMDPKLLRAICGRIVLRK